MLQKRTRGINLERTLLFCVIVCTTVLLFLRDVVGYSINKYIFIALLVPPLLFFRAPYVYYLWAMIMPLYVGLPGNIITLMMICRFFLQETKCGTVPIVSRQFICSLLYAIFVFVQNIITGFVGSYYMAFILEIAVVYFIMTIDHKGYVPGMILFYNWGIALVGVVMLAVALQKASFSELLSVGSRLGYLGRTATMTIIVDPNYYGLFAITSIASNWCLATRGKYTTFQKIVAILSSAIALAIGIIGLSRAFILSLAFWLFLALLYEKRIKIKIVLLILAVVACVVMVTVLSDSVDALIERFQGDDMATGNGRTEKALYTIRYWLRTPITMLFGYGLFNCVAHFMQLQYLAGMGIIGFCLVFAWYFGFWSVRRPRIRRVDWTTMIPIIVVQFAAATVPTAQSMTFMMPVVISILVFGEANRI